MRKQLLFLFFLLFFAVTHNYAQNIFPSEKDGVWGYVDNRGKWKIKPQYHYAGNFHDGLACVMKYFNHNNSIVKLYGFIDEKGKLVIPMEYNYASDFHKGIAIVGIMPGTHFEPQKKWNQGAVTSNLIELQFINLEGTLSHIENNFHLAKFCANDTIRMVKCEFISHSNSYRDRKKAFVAKEFYEVKVSRSEINDSFTHTCKFEGFNRIPNDTVEKQIDALNNLNTEDFKWALTNDGIIYCVTNELLPAISEDLYDATRCNHKLISKSHWGMWGFVNDEGRWVLPAKYDWVEEKNNGVLNKHLQVHCFSGWGILDSLGVEKIPAIYDSIYAIDDHFSAIQKDGLTGIVNDSWEIIVPPNSQRSHIRIHRKYNRITYLGSNGVYHMTDTLGVLIQKANMFDDQININDKAIAFKDSIGKYGLMGLDGRIVLPPSYDFMFFYGGFIMIKQYAPEKEGALSYEGKVILPCRYSDINGVGNIIEVIENKSEEESKLYNIQGELLRDDNGIPIMKERYSGINKGNTIMSVKSKNGRIVMTLDGILLSEFYYSKVEHNEKTKEFYATRIDTKGTNIIDIFDDITGTLVKTIKE